MNPACRSCSDSVVTPLRRDVQVADSSLEAAGARGRETRAPSGMEEREKRGREKEIHIYIERETEKRERERESTEL